MTFPCLWDGTPAVTQIDVDVMPETSTDSRPNVPKSVNLNSSCTVDDDFNSLPSESASCDSNSTVNHTQ